MRSVLFVSVSVVFVASVVAIRAQDTSRGQQLLAAQCGFCHGSNARGGSSGPDLTRSPLVQEDEQGRQLGEFLRDGRPDRGMPKFDQLSNEQIADLAAFLHATIRASVNRGGYRILDILVGDPKAGEAYFNGAGRCASCHSTTGDLKAIGSKYDPVVLQGRIVMPRGRPSVAAPGPPRPAYLDSTAVKATVRNGADSFTGALVRLTDFDVVVYNQTTGETRSWLRSGGVPNVAVTDPLQAHVDLLTKWTDEEMHNVTAFLAGVK
jgi:mono/diheme cytochrome c family protein